METMVIPNPFPATMPIYAGPQGGPWRPAPHSVMRAYPMSRPAQQHWSPGPARLGQTQPSAPASIAKGADVLFSILTAIGAMTVGIAAMTVGVGGNPKAVPPTGSSGTWKWIGGITAALGALVILSNVSKISKASEMVVPTASVQMPQ